MARRNMTPTEKLYRSRHPAIPRLLRQAEQAAREWEWAKAERFLDRAYHLAGAENPGSGYDFHRGVHPIQRETPIGLSVLEIVMAFL